MGGGAALGPRNAHAGAQGAAGKGRGVQPPPPVVMHAVAPVVVRLSPAKCFAIAASCNLQMTLKVADLGHLTSSIDVHKHWVSRLEEVSGCERCGDRWTPVQPGLAGQ